MDEAKAKHLELIQATILRMGQNSFIYKGWTVTLVAAIFVLAAKNDLNPWYLLIALLPAVTFWGLDGFYLRQERLFRRHYDAVRLASLEQWQKDPFSMHVRPYQQQEGGWLIVCASKTVASLYLPMILLTVIASLLARHT